MADSERVAFPAIIKQVSIKRTASEDREARAVFDFRPDTDVMDGLVRLSQRDEEIWVVVMDKVPK